VFMFCTCASVGVLVASSCAIRLSTAGVYGAAASNDGEPMLDGRETGSEYGGVSAAADDRTINAATEAAPKVTSVFATRPRLRRGGGAIRVPPIESGDGGRGSGERPSQTAWNLSSLIAEIWQ
jgi:hypothetical protein